MNKLHVFAAAAAASLAAASPASAQNVTADVDQIAEVMRAEGFQAKIDEENDYRFITSGMSGYNFRVLPYGCEDDGSACKWVQLRAAFAPDTKPTLAEINQYAADNFFGRYYLDGDKDPVIEMDIDLEAGGMSRELFVDNLAYWDSAMSKFAEFAFSKDD